MRIAIDIGVILLVGVALGWGVRAMRSHDDAPVPAEANVVDRETMRVVELDDEPEATPLSEEEWLTRFELTERSGEPLHSDQLLGQPYVVSFFFTNCPSICVTQNQKLQELQETFRGEGVRFLAISVDPEADTPEQLRQYAARFEADPEQWLFLTGEMTYIRRVAGEIFKVAANKQFHTEKFLLVDPTGQLHSAYSWNEPRQLKRLEEDIREMLEQVPEQGEAA